MRRITYYRIQKESMKAMRKGQRYHPALEISFRDRTGTHTHILSAGYADALDVYRQGRETYILSINPRLGYVGLQVFEGAVDVGDIFLQEGQVAETIGSLDLAPYTLIRRLREYVNP